MLQHTILYVSKVIKHNLGGSSLQKYSCSQQCNLASTCCLAL